MKQVQQNFNNHWSIRRTQAGKGNWLGQEPWQDENHQVIPNFIQGIAERQPFYKALLARFPNDPDSVNYYYKEEEEIGRYEIGRASCREEGRSRGAPDH